MSTLKMLNDGIDVAMNVNNVLTMKATSFEQLLASVKIIMLSTGQNLKQFTEELEQTNDNGKQKIQADEAQSKNKQKKSEQLYALVEHLLTMNKQSFNFQYIENSDLKRLVESSKQVESKLDELKKQVQLVIPQSLDKLNENIEKVVNEQLDSKRSWAQVVSKTKIQPEPSTNQVRKFVRESLLEKQKMDARKCNVVVFGLKELHNDENDLTSFKSICEGEIECKVDLLSSRRLGQRSDNVTRPLLVTCKNENDKRKLLLSAKRLRQSSNDLMKKVYISPDLTKEERQFLKKKREEWKNKQNVEATTDTIIKNQTIEKNQ